MELVGSFQLFTIRKLYHRGRRHGHQLAALQVRDTGGRLFQRRLGGARGTRAGQRNCGGPFHGGIRAHK